MDTESKIILAIVGSRTFNNKPLFNEHVNNWVKKYGKPDTIVSGGAKGADTLAEIYAKEHSISFVVFEADWKKYGAKAGPIRNTQIIEYSTHVLAFPSHSGKGTQDSIHKSKHLKKPITIIYID